MMMPPTKHAAISPSKLQRIIDCPGSLQLAQKYEIDGSSVYAQEGTMLHGVVETFLRQWSGAVDQLVDPDRKVIASLLKHQLEVDEPEADEPVNIYTLTEPVLTNEHIEAVENCLIYLGNVIRTCGPGWSMEVEASVTLASYHSCLFDTDGTSDIIIWDPWNNRIIVIDWKFGKGVIVYADNNDQLMSYGVGGMLRNPEYFCEDFKLDLHVVQPRIDQYSNVTLTYGELKKWLESRVIPGVQAAYSDMPPFIPGPKQCRWCPASTYCRARYNLANQTAADVFKAIAKMPDDVTIEELSEILLRGDDLEQYLKDIAAFIQRKLEAGQAIPGWKLVAGRSIRTWSDVHAAEEWLLKHADYDQIYETKLVTPAKAEKINKTFKKDEDFLDLIYKPEGSPTLVPESDKRPPLKFRTAEEIFASHVEDK